ncbi:mitochondrial distribution and morphology proteins-domain-containing protein [Lactarius deliciosus]|nr:mitochondrial distribution and morphology proteins-domain-containing protein [Lactarius deliciosus]
MKAAVPIWTSELSYSSIALIRPVVAFMNANRTLAPVRCRVIKGLENFDGSWTVRLSLLRSRHCLSTMPFTRCWK